MVFYSSSWNWSLFLSFFLYSSTASVSWLYKSHSGPAPFWGSESQPVVSCWWAQFHGFSWPLAVKYWSSPFLHRDTVLFLFCLVLFVCVCVPSLGAQLRKTPGCACVPFTALPSAPYPSVTQNGGLQLVVRYWWHQSYNFGSPAWLQCLEMFVLLHLSLEISCGLHSGCEYIPYNMQHLIISLKKFKTIPLDGISDPRSHVCSAQYSTELHNSLTENICAHWNISLNRPSNLLGSGLQGAHPVFMVPSGFLCVHIFWGSKNPKSPKLMLLSRITLCHLLLKIIFTPLSVLLSGLTRWKV